jgi:hypothetical protein
MNSKETVKVYSVVEKGLVLLNAAVYVGTLASCLGDPKLESQPGTHYPNCGYS